MRRGAREVGELAEFLWRHRDLVGATSPADEDAPHARGRQRIERMVDDVRSGELLGGLGEDARDVERDIAIADHRYRCAVEGRGEVGMVGVAIVPADERGRSDHAGEVCAGNAERAIGGCAGRDHHRVVEAAQLLDRDILADRDMAEETHRGFGRDAFVAARDRLDRLVIGRHARTDQTKGHGLLVDQVDPHIVAERPEAGFRRVEAGWPRSDHRDVAHADLPPRWEGHASLRSAMRKRGARVSPTPLRRVSARPAPLRPRWRADRRAG